MSVRDREIDRGHMSLADCRSLCNVKVFARGTSVTGGSRTEEQFGAFAARPAVLKALDLAP